MNTNYLKRRQVVSAGNDHNQTYAKKIRSEEIEQTICSENNSDGGEFPMFCKDNARTFV